MWVLRVYAVGLQTDPKRYLQTILWLWVYEHKQQYYIPKITGGKTSKYICPSLINRV